MPEVGGWLAALGPSASVLGLLIVLVVALLGLSLAFAAYTVLLRVRSDRRARLWTRLVAAWEAPVLRALVDPDAAVEVHASVSPRHHLHFVDFLLEYARRVAGDERDVLRGLAAPYLAPLVDRASDRRIGIRARAVQTLGELGLPEHEASVVAALDDPAPLVAMVAALALAEQKNAGYVGPILERLPRFDTWSPTFLAAMLADIGPDAAPDLRRALADPGASDRVRAVAARALDELHDFEAGPLAAQLALTSSDTDLRVAALRLLRHVGQPAHRPAVLAATASEDPAVRAAAFRALGTLGTEDDVPPLVGALSDPSPWVAIGAARGLLEAGRASLLRDFGASDHPRALLASQVLVEEGG